MSNGSRQVQTPLNPLQTPITRRTALRLIGGGVAGTALVAAADLSRVMGLAGTGPVDAWADDTPVNPVYGAGIYDVDPSQGTVSQSTSVVVTGDVTSLPLGMEF